MNFRIDFLFWIFFLFLCGFDRDLITILYYRGWYGNLNGGKSSKPWKSNLCHILYLQHLESFTLQIFTSWINYSVLCLVAQSCLTLCNPMDCSPPGSPVHGDSPGKNIGVGGHALLQGIFLAQGSNSDLPHCRQILYHLSPQGSLVIYSFCCICNFPSKLILLLHRNASEFQC